MNENEKLEYYLLSLERLLSDQSAAKRAEIVLDVRNQIKNLIDSGMPFDQAITQVGSVEQVAQKFGVHYKHKTSRIVRITKWILFISILSFFLVMGGVWYVLHHLFDFSDNLEFHLNQDQFNVATPELDFDGGESLLDETKDAHSLGIKKLEMKFSNGKVRFSNSTDGQMSWRCKLKGTDGTGTTKTEGDTVSVNLLESIGSKCDVKIPEGVSLSAKGGNGEVKIVEPMFSVDLKLANGKIGIIPHSKKEYVYDIQVINGRVGDFISSQKADALVIKLRMTNGVISHDTE